MSKDTKPSTDSLEKLIQLKRWEEPPPGHLDRLSSRIIAQIEADRALANETIWSRFFGVLDFKPVLACAYCAGAMGLLVVGLGMKNNLTQPQITTRPNPADSYRLTGMQALKQPAEARPRAASFSLPNRDGLWRSPTASNWNSSQSGSHPQIMRSSVSGMPLPLGAQLLRSPLSSQSNSTSNQVSQPVNFHP